jgi:hypothetical protein
MTTLDDEDGYTGEATLRLGEATLSVQAELRGHFQPIDGYYHWYGRIAAHDELSRVLGSNKADAELTTPQGSASGQVSDPDPWGRYRITGTSRPPFRAATELAE